MGGDLGGSEGESRKDSRKHHLGEAEVFQVTASDTYNPCSEKFRKNSWERESKGEVGHAWDIAL
jgi:hypothetical protein